MRLRPAIVALLLLAAPAVGGSRAEPSSEGGAGGSSPATPAAGVAARIASSASGAAFPGDGRTIASIVLRYDGSPEDVTMLGDVLRLAAGDRLTPASLRQALLALQGLRQVSDVEAYTRPVGDQVELVLVAWSNVMVSSVDFTGELAHKPDELRRLVAVREAGPLLESQILRSVFALQDRLEEDGYLEGVVRVRVEPTPSGRRAAVTFQVDAGSRALVGGIDFTGELGEIGADSLRRAVRTQVGGRYWPQRARGDAKTAQQYLFDQGYRTARVSRPETSYDFGTHRVDLVYEVELGPRVEVEVIGAERRKLVKQGLLPFLGSQGYDPALLVYTVDRVRAWYQSKGHYRVEIEAEEVVSTEERIEVEIRIDPGPELTLAEIAFRGNDTLSSDTLRGILLSAEKRFLSPGTGRLVASLLEEDLGRLRSYYALQGFREARVGPAEVTESNGELRLEIPIDEGPRRMVDTIVFSGVERLSERDLAATLPIRPGGPFHQSLLDQAVTDIRSLYREEGFDNVLASAEVAWDEAGRRADVTFFLLEGPQTVVRRVLIRGQQVTSTFLLQDLVDLEPGEPVSRSRLLEIQRRLYRLGVFRQAEVEFAQGELLGGERDVLVRVEEGDRHRLSLGGGYDTEDGVRGLFGYSIGNLFGRAGSLNLDTVVSQRDQLYRLIFTQPVLAGLDLPVTYSVFRSREEEPARSEAFGGDFVTDIRGAQVEASLPVGAIRMPLLLTYKRVDNNAPLALEEIFFEREKAEVDISSVGTALLLDRRDSQINPTRGSNTVVQLEYAAEAFGTDENFVKLFVQQTQYLDFGRLGILGASLRLGGIESYRAPLPATTGNGEEGIPFPCGPDLVPDFGVAISERFFAGGRSTHRAYDLDTLGILGQTLFVNRRQEESGPCEEVGLFASGGNGLALLNVDLRYPIGESFWATVFYDWGNVFADWRDISTGELKGGIGTGVGWDSPIGPLRLEIGWKLDRERFEDSYQIFLSFGSAF